MQQVWKSFRLLAGSPSFPLRHLPGGLELTGELGWRAALAMRGLLLLKKLRRMPHLRDSSRALFPDPE